MRTRGRHVLPGAAAAAVAATLLLAGCPSPADERAAEADPGRVESVSVSDEQISTADGAVLLTIDAMPADIRVNDTTDFGVAQRFTHASPSPDGEWIAVVTSGAAHSGGWLVRAGTQAPQPAAFQYGGSMRVGGWSADGRQVVFVHTGPAGDQTLTVADRERLGPTVAATAIPVRTPDHDTLRPEERMYESPEWRDGRLVFQMRMQSWAFNPETRAVQRQN